MATVLMTCARQAVERLIRGLHNGQTPAAFVWDPYLSDYCSSEELPLNLLLQYGAIMNRLLHHAECACTECISHPAHARPGIHIFPDKLHVVTMVSNPLRWRSRYWNYWMFEQECEKAGVILYTAEIAFGGRHFEVTDPNNPRHIQLRTNSEVWHKENALNLMIQRLPQDAKYIAWIDADVKFARADWAQETLHQLQHYEVIQMFSHCQDVGPMYEPVGPQQVGFLYKWVQNQGNFHEADFAVDPNCIEASPYPYPYNKKIGHPGYAWAARRTALDSLGMLIDWAILGSADYHMACALIGKVRWSLNDTYSPAYLRLSHEWEARAEKHIKRNVGFMSGLLTHFWHGRKSNRAYDLRWKLLGNTDYDPEYDLKKDWQGLFQLTDRSIMLRDGLRQYARLRNEDSDQL